MTSNKKAASPRQGEAASENAQANSRISDEVFTAIRHLLDATAAFRRIGWVPPDALEAVHILTARLAVEITRLGRQP